jgi:hypothetical protein
VLKLVALLAIALHSPRPDLKQTVLTWQGKLRLTGWRIGIETVDDRALGGKSVGDIHWDAGTRVASIRVLREQDYDLPVRMARLDQRATVVHELVHLRHATDNAQEGPGDEGLVVRETNGLLESNHQWRILAAQER